MWSTGRTTAHGKQYVISVGLHYSAKKCACVCHMVFYSQGITQKESSEKEKRMFYKPSAFEQNLHILKHFNEQVWSTEN